MSSSAMVIVDLVIIAALHTLVAEEMNCLVVDSGKSFARICFRLYVSQAVSLVPAGRKDIE